MCFFRHERRVKSSTPMSLKVSLRSVEDLTLLSYLKNTHSTHALYTNTHVYMSNRAYLAVSYCLFSHRKVQVSCGRGVDCIMSGSERMLLLGHCVSDIGCIGFSWNDSRRGGGGGGGWRKNNFIIHHHIPGPRT